MSGICSTTARITSDADLAKPFRDSILPDVNNDGRMQSGDLKGRLSAVKLQSIYDTLVKQDNLVSNEDYQQNLRSVGDTKKTSNTTAQSILNNLGSKESATMQKIQSEYCYYYVRYRYALETLFDKLVSTSKLTTLPDADKTDIQSKLTRAKQYNEKLNDIIQITNYIAQKRSSEMRDQNADINSANENIKSTFDTLQSHAKILNSETSISDLRKRMVEFTEEKNRSAMNLLSLYGFLNLVAIGLLVYIARS